MRQLNIWMLVASLLATVGCGSDEPPTVYLRVYTSDGDMNKNVLVDQNAQTMEVIVSGADRPFVQTFNLGSGSGELSGLPSGENMQLFARGYRTEADGSRKLIFYGGTSRFDVVDGNAPLLSLQVGRANCIGLNQPSVFRDETAKGDLQERRVGMSVSKLPNGWVLIAGGAELDPVTGEINRVLSTVEIYDPAQSQFIPAGFELTEPRAFHTATVLQDGQVLIAGGITGPGQPPSVTNTVSIVNIQGPFFETNVNVGTFEPRHGHMATRLSDGSVVIAGGLGAAGTALASSYRYFPVDGSFRIQRPLGSARHFSTMHPITRDYEWALVVGGLGEDGTPLRSVELFTTSPTQEGCVDGLSASADNGCWVDLRSGLELERPTWGHASVVSTDGKRVTVVGGYTSNDRSEATTKVAELDLATIEYREVGDLPVAVGEAAAELGFDGDYTYVLVSGGRVGNTPIQSIVRMVRTENSGQVAYTPQALENGCVQPGVIPEARWGARAIELDNRTILILGGATRSTVGTTATLRSEIYFPPQVVTPTSL